VATDEAEACRGARLFLMRLLLGPAGIVAEGVADARHV
jgi:hypothetical protein